MNFADALNALYQGKKIRRKAWSMNTSYQLKNGAFITFNTKDLLAEDWEAVGTEDLLSRKEKEYLENLLRPYLDSYEFIFEKESKDEQDFLKISIFPYDEYKKIKRIYLPLYEISEPMFVSLEKDYEYTADDLNLFHE